MRLFVADSPVYVLFVCCSDLCAVQCANTGPDWDGTLLTPPCGHIIHRACLFNRAVGALALEHAHCPQCRDGDRWRAFAQSQGAIITSKTQKEQTADEDHIRAVELAQQEESQVRDPLLPVLVHPLICSGLGG